MSKHYEVVIVVAPPDPRVSDDPLVNVQGFYPPGVDGLEQIKSLPPGVRYIHYEGSGKLDEDGLPAKFMRRDSWERKEDPEPPKPKLKKLT